MTHEDQPAAVARGTVGCHGRSPSVTLGGCGSSPPMTKTRRRDVTDDRSSIWLADRFEANRPHLRAVAYRMLGSVSEADDAVQEAWLRLSRTDATRVENLGGWLTTVVARVSLDMLRSRNARREEPLGVARARADREQRRRRRPRAAGAARRLGRARAAGGARDAVDPAERLAFVLHDMFGVPFDEIAPIVERSPAAARQLASRARRRRARSRPGAGRRPRPRSARSSTRSWPPHATATSTRSSRCSTPTSCSASTAGRAPRGRSAARRSSPARRSPSRSSPRSARPALVNGAAGFVVEPARAARVSVAGFTVTDGKIAEIDLLADPARLRSIELG